MNASCQQATDPTRVKSTIYTDIGDLSDGNTKLAHYSRALDGEL